MRRSTEPRVPSQGELSIESGAGDRRHAELVNLSASGACALVGAAERAAGSTTPRALRLRLDGGPALRAEAESIDEGGAIIAAELPWLMLGGGVVAEVDGLEQGGRIDWVGMDVAPSGAARLRIRVAFVPSARARRDDTLPYFSPAALARSTPSRPSATQGAMRRVSALVRLGEQRRVRLGLLRVAVGVLALSALVLGAIGAASTSSEPVAADERTAAPLQAQEARTEAVATSPTTPSPTAAATPAAPEAPTPAALAPEAIGRGAKSKASPTRSSARPRAGGKRRVAPRHRAPLPLPPGAEALP